MMKIETGEQLDSWQNFFLTKIQRSNGPVYAMDLVNPMESEERAREFDKYCVYWAALNAILFVMIVVGNVLTILAVRLTRTLRQVASNLFILNLAISDLMVGLTLPYDLAFCMDERLAEHKITCITRFVALSLACTSSTYSLIVIAIDRYIAVVHPLKYARHFTRTTILVIIFFGWFYSIAISTVPIYWNNYDDASQCEFETIVPRCYTIVILCPVICIVWMSMFILYWRIWRAARNHARRLKETGYTNAGLDDCKGARVALSVLGCFTICCLPYLIVTCTRLFHLEPQGFLYKAFFSLAMANSGMNPIIYAWKNTKFRKAFDKLLRFKGPNERGFNTSLNDYLQKQNELTRREIY